jgi:hypothetical protein
MKRFFLTVMMALFAFTSLTTTVEAKRLGGGGSYGKQGSRMATPPSAPMRQAPAPAAPIRQQAQPAPAPAYPAQAPQQARSGMGGMVGGALLGLGVGSMLGNGANAANNNGANGNNTATNPNAVDSVPAQSSGGGGSSLLMILAVAGIAFFLYRRFRR